VQTPFVPPDFVIGQIALWAGSYHRPPPKWQLCDGTNGTPDLRDRFILGAGDSFDPDDIGGLNRHEHIFESADHTHIFDVGNDLLPGDGWTSSPIIEKADGVTDFGSSMPPYTALRWIMRVKP